MDDFARNIGMRWSLGPAPCSMRARRLALGAALWLFFGCAPKSPELKPPPVGPFVISDYFAPSGAFGDGATPGNVVINENLDCKDRPPGARGHCFSFIYQDIQPYVDPATGNSGACTFAGVFWQSPPNNWGTDPGLPIEDALPRLRGVSFYAAAAAGTLSANFGVGGIGLPPGAQAGYVCPPTSTPPGPYYDQIGLPAGVSPPPHTVTTEWMRFQIPIVTRVTPVQTLLGAFSWATAWPGQPVTIYIDDLVYEGDDLDAGR